MSDNLKLPQPKGAPNEPPKKESVHSKTAVPCPLRRPALFRPDADRSEARRPGALAPWSAASQAGRLQSAQWHALGGALHTSDRSLLAPRPHFLLFLFQTEH